MRPLVREKLFFVCQDYFYLGSFPEPGTRQESFHYNTSIAKRCAHFFDINHNTGQQTFAIGVKGYDSIATLKRSCTSGVCAICMRTIGKRLS